MTLREIYMSITFGFISIARKREKRGWSKNVFKRFSRNALYQTHTFFGCNHSWRFCSKLNSIVIQSEICCFNSRFSWRSCSWTATVSIWSSESLIPTCFRSIELRSPTVAIQPIWKQFAQNWFSKCPTVMNSNRITLWFDNTHKHKPTRRKVGIKDLVFDLSSNHLCTRWAAKHPDKAAVV